MRRGMKRIITPAIFLSASILAGCAQDAAPTAPGNDELAGETNDGEAPKADAAHDNFGFMAVEKTDAFQLSRPNRSTIKCNDGEYHDACGVQSIAWDKLLTKAQTTKVEAAIERQAMDPSLGVQVLVKGEYKVYGDFVAFEPTEVWLAQKTDGNTDGTFVRLFDRGIRCITAPCPQYEEGRLNSSRQMNIDGIDFGDTSDSLQEKIYTATTSPDGVILAGERTHHSAVSFVDELRTADQVFLRLK
jgi:hypothetical protein